MSNQLLQQIYNDPRDSDVHICLHSGETFYAHSLVLKNRSPVLRAMLSGDWVESASGQLRFTNGDASVVRVLRAIYLGNSLTPPNKVYKVLKFAHYLQTDDVIKQLAETRISEIAHVVKIAMLLQDYDKSLYDMYTQKLPWPPGRALAMHELCDIAKCASADEYTWCVENIRKTPCSEYIVALFAVYYADSCNESSGLIESSELLALNAHQSAVEAIRLIDTSDYRAKTAISEAFRDHVPNRYADMIVSMFTNCANAHGCGITGTLTCLDCGYRYCSACQLRGSARCWSCRNSGCDDCPRCKFVVNIGHFSICAACVSTIARSRGLMYCYDHKAVITCRQLSTHDKCDVTYDHNVTLSGYVQQYGEQLAQMLSRRFAALAWAATDTPDGVNAVESRLRVLWTVLQSVSTIRRELNAGSECKK